MPDNRRADTVLKWWLDGDTDGGEMIVEALIRPVPSSMSKSGMAVDAVVTLNDTEIATEHMCLGENHARTCALMMARAAIGALEQVHGKRGEPQLSRDYYGDLFIVIDDDGEPVSDYKLTLKAAREYREDHGDIEHYRIAKVPYKALPRDDGEPDEIVDDPAAGREG